MIYDVNFSKTHGLKEAITYSYLQQRAQNGAELYVYVSDITNDTGLTRYQAHEAMKYLGRHNLISYTHSNYKRFEVTIA